MLPSEFLLSYASFNADNKPFVECQVDGKIERYELFEQNLSLEFDFSVKYCTGWVDFENRCSQICPDHATVDEKYENCLKCRDKTGFNPAFYNVKDGEISKQQIERNLQPHFVYLAYFSDETIKVGISFAGRGIARLLEQGARAALILGEFSSANIARNYEEKISKMTDFCENVKANVKLKLLEQDFVFSKAEKALLDARKKIETAQKVVFEKQDPIDLNKFYAKNGKIPSGEILEIQNCPQNQNDKTLIFSGILKAQVGYILLAEQQGEIISIPLKKFTGRKIRISSKIIELNLPERQASLFDF